MDAFLIKQQDVVHSITKALEGCFCLYKPLLVYSLLRNLTCLTLTLKKLDKFRKYACTIHTWSKLHPDRLLVDMKPRTLLNLLIFSTNWRWIWWSFTYNNLTTIYWSTTTTTTTSTTTTSTTTTTTNWTKWSTL